MNSPASPPPEKPDAPPGNSPDYRGLLQAGLQADTNPGAPADGSEDTRSIHPEEPLSVAEIQKDFPFLEILEPIGGGGMGMVFKARQKSLDRPVALKILKSRFSHDPQFAERFAREAKALARLNHPNIVTIHDFGQASGRFYFLMEYMDGANLRQVMRRGLMKPAEALAIVPKVCEALQYAHEEGIVHRDIKPENILLDSRGRVKVADFGLAKLLGISAQGPALTQASSVMGTPYYMAPEQLDHPQDVDQRADVYAVGVLLYEMLTGEVPMGRFAPPSARVQVDVRLDEVVLRALERDPEQRYQRIEDIKSRIDGITSTAAVVPGSASNAGAAPATPATAPPASSPPAGSANEWWRGRPWQVWFCCAILLWASLTAASFHRGSEFVALVTILFNLLLAAGLIFRYRTAFVVSVVFALVAIVVGVATASLISALINVAFLMALFKSRSWFFRDREFTPL